MPDIFVAFEVIAEPRVNLESVDCEGLYRSEIGAHLRAKGKCSAEPALLHLSNLLSWSVFPPDPRPLTFFSSADKLSQDTPHGPRGIGAQDRKLSDESAARLGLALGDGVDQKMTPGLGLLVVWSVRGEIINVASPRGFA